MQEVTGSSPVPSTTIPRPFGLGIFLWWTVQDSNSTAERSEGNQSPGGALVSARFPTRRNVYRDAGTVWGFFCGGRYRTRTARAERSEGNQSPSGALISARFPTRRNVYRDAGTVWGFFCGGRYRTRTGRLCGFRFANFTLSEMFFP